MRCVQGVIMTPAEDPERLLDDPDTSSELEAMLRADELAEPSATDLAAIGSALGIAPMSVPPPPAAVATSTSAVSPIAIGAGAVAIAAIVAGGVWMLTTRTDVEYRPPRVTRPVAREVHSEPLPVVTETAAPVEQIVVSPNEPPARRARRAPRVEAPVIAMPAPEPAAEETSRSAAWLEEMRVVGRAERALASDPAAALRLANEHRSLYPNGVLAEEREVVAIDALIRLDRRPDAERRARAFEARHGRSVHTRRVERLLRAP
jgi:hypothetical protein